MCAVSPTASFGHASRPHAIRARLRRAFGAVIILVVAMAVMTAMFASGSVRDGQASTNKVNTVARLVDGQLEDAIHAEAAAVAEFVRTHGFGASQDFEDAEDAVVEAIVALRAFGDPELDAIATNMHEAHDRWADAWFGEVRQEIESGGVVDGRVLSEGEALQTELSAALDATKAFVVRMQGLAMVSSTETAARGTLMVLTLLGAVMFGLAVVGLIITRSVNQPLDRLLADTRRARETGVAAFDVSRQDEIGELAQSLQDLHEDLAARYESVRLDAERAGLFGRLSERLSSTSDESELIDASAAVLQRLIPYASGSISLLNPSANRLTVVAAWGAGAPRVGERLEGDPNGCPAVRRSIVHIVRDDGDPLAVHCRLQPVDSGHQGCMPMLAMGKVVGVLHLWCPTEVEIDPAAPGNAQRVTEQLGLALANTRLTRTMERLAMTDPLTGLGNARSFDAMLGDALRAAEATGRELAVLFLDLDHFKVFNDTYGHPAGDEALRMLGSTITSVVRETDVVARYGGEEFVVAVPGVDLDAATAVAEKIRYAVEQMVVALGPGRFARVTASIGVAATNTHGRDAAALLRTADAALYTAKTAGRNRVVAAAAPTSVGHAESGASRSLPERRGRRNRSAGVVRLVG